MLFMRLAASLLGLLAVLASLEAALRVYERFRPGLSAGAQFSAPDPELGWRNAPGARGLFRTQGREARVRINALGLRGEPLLPEEAGKGLIRILLLGDSVTAGFEVEERDTFAARLQGALNACGGGSPLYEVVNAGVRGYGTDQSLLYYEREGKKLGASLVVYTLVHNDLHENTQAAGLNGSYPKPLFRLEEGRLVLEPPSRGSLAQEAGGTLARALRSLERRSRLAGWTAAWLGAMRPGPPEWGRDIAPEYLSPRPEKRLEARTALFQALLARLAEGVRADRAQFLFLIFPGHWELSAEALLRTLGPPAAEVSAGARMDPGAFHAAYLGRAAAMGLQTMETLPSFRRSAESGKNLHVPDAHLNPQGHALLADLLLRRIVEGGLVPLPPGARERCLQRLAEGPGNAS